MRLCKARQFFLLQFQIGIFIAFLQPIGQWLSPILWRLFSFHPRIIGKVCTQPCGTSQFLTLDYCFARLYIITIGFLVTLAVFEIRQPLGTVSIFTINKILMKACLETSAIVVFFFIQMTWTYLCGTVISLVTDVTSYYLLPMYRLVLQAHFLVLSQHFYFFLTLYKNMRKANVQAHQLCFVYSGGSAARLTIKSSFHQLMEYRCFGNRNLTMLKI